MTEAVERVRDAILPALAGQQLELYDVEVHGGLVKVIVDRHEGAVDLDSLSEVTRAVSRALDDADPVPHRYTLEVTSPGVERPLRTPEHFIRAVGETIKVKTTTEIDGTRRLEGVLSQADQESITVRTEEGEAGTVVAYDDIARARTVFEWGTARHPKPPGSSKKKRERKS